MRCRALRDVLQGLAAPKPRSGRNRRRCAPVVEPLECRLLLTTFYVNDDAAPGGDGSSGDEAFTTIQTAVNAAQTARACARITAYLALVKAHTGKKLTPDQAILLTTEATDLADELGC